MDRIEVQANEICMMYDWCNNCPLKRSPGDHTCRRQNIEDDMLIIKWHKILFNPIDELDIMTLFND